MVELEKVQASGEMRMNTYYMVWEKKKRSLTEIDEQKASHQTNRLEDAPRSSLQG